MVTFSIPGDDVVEPTTNGTPRSRPPLPFAKRAYATASPFGGSSAKRLGTPHTSSARKLLATRDEAPASSLNQSSIGTARNIFRASTIADSPPTSSFSPSIPNSTMKKVFAPGATPEPSRMYRNSIAQATPRGMAAKTTNKELFPMRIASPPPELTGEVLTQKVPKEWNAKGSIYADQFLAHLCPPELDEEQRRQFFCVLDLRRLKYAANEIFARKDWKLNVINFAKEFEKSRSIILLRYGLYEFQNVKPSKDVLKRWRREHGLPEPEDEEESEATPSKPATSKKRKATEDYSETPALKGKRRAVGDESEPVAAPVATSSAPSVGKSKRKASVSEEQPSKMQKPPPSSAKSLLEKITNNTKTAEGTTAAPAPKPKPFSASKPAAGSSLARSVFTNLKPPGTQAGHGGAGGNIFGYLSDASSAKNSGVDADAESESDSDQDGSQEAGQSDEPSVVASGAGDTGSQIGASLFDRVTKGSDGQHIRIEEKIEVSEPEPESEAVSEAVSEPVSEKPAVTDQTWNPTTTPIKFAPPSTPAAPGSVFGTSGANSGSTVFAPKPTATSNFFGTAKQDQPAAKESSTGANASEGGKDGGESDKENESQSSKKGPFDTKPAAAPSPFGSSLQSKPAAAEVPKAAEAPKPAASLFAAKPDAAKPAETTTTTSASSLFGQASKPAESTSFTQFGAKPTEPGKVTTAEGPKPAASLFGSTASSAAAPATGNAGALFGSKPASTASGIFGGGAATPTTQPQQSLFGTTSGATSDSTAAKADTPKPFFNFGGSNTGAPSATASKPQFSLPQSPPSSASANNMFGSPMKQDDPSPAKKKTFNGGSADGSSAPLFNFGATSQPPASTSSIFAASSAPAQNGSSSSAAPIFAGAPSNTSSGSTSFNFSFGGASTDGASKGSFNNPFSSAGGNNATAAAAPGSGATFSFTAGSTPAGTSPFQFGGNSGNASTSTGTGGLVLGANQGTNNAAPIFGGTPGSGSAPSFNFSAGGAAPQGTGSVFGSNQAVPAFNLQPPAGGSTTTGTNSPLNFGGGSSLATTPAAGTPEPSTQADTAKDGEATNEDGGEHEQINLTDGVNDDEEVRHEVRAKVLKFVPASEKSDEDKPKSKSPWSTQGVGQLRLLQHKETKLVRLLLRAEPRGHVALNRALLPNLTYKADEKYVKLTTSNEKGDGLETWMIQVKTKDLAKELAELLEKNKEANKK
ncbi:hypothetical protein J3458_004517 [Metarhizium acridum]|uniref:Nucleoporin nsp1 n=1 Tax=Metarhizium acridum (strain CQMa 102) TaxID=655827 RepID=E9DU43_METAQ|nr:nucleoporin nsp1 [Metarhizium acridum CQMa 102]EFY92903.1 nucleoporin nsp1 [Metarhizium acridum CQMa 102]KAG8419668.1 hypothetical protein J3458_004517 [Metarhizium acridum]